MKIEMWDIDRPIDYPQNARKWSKQAIDKVGVSIKAFGWRQPVVVDNNGVELSRKRHSERLSSADWFFVPGRVLRCE
jgi:hypothetical protein